MIPVESIFLIEKLCSLDVVELGKVLSEISRATSCDFSLTRSLPVLRRDGLHHVEAAHNLSHWREAHAVEKRVLPQRNEELSRPRVLKREKERKKTQGNGVGGRVTLPEVANVTVPRVLPTAGMRGSSGMGFFHLALLTGSAARPNCTTNLGTTRKKPAPSKKLWAASSFKRAAPRGAHSGVTSTTKELPLGARTVVVNSIWVNGDKLTRQRRPKKEP